MLHVTKPSWKLSCQGFLTSGSVSRPTEEFPDLHMRLCLPPQGANFTTAVDGCNVAYYQQNNEGGQFAVSQVLLSQQTSPERS